MAETRWAEALDCSATSDAARWASGEMLATASAITATRRPTSSTETPMASEGLARTADGGHALVGAARAAGDDGHDAPGHRHRRGFVQRSGRPARSKGRWPADVDAVREG